MKSDRDDQQRFTARRLAFGCVPLLLLAALLVTPSILLRTTSLDAARADAIVDWTVVAAIVAIFRPSSTMSVRAVLLGPSNVLRSLALAFVATVAIDLIDITAVHLWWARPLRFRADAYTLSGTAGALLLTVLIVLVVSGGVQTTLLRFSSVAALIGGAISWATSIDGFYVALSHAFFGDCCSRAEYGLAFVIALLSGAAFSTIGWVTRSLAASTLSLVVWVAALPLL